MQTSIKSQKTYVVGKPRPRTLAEIADEIADDWDDPPERAGEIIDTLRTVERVTDPVHEGTAGDLCLELLRLAKEWPGEVAKRVRHELRAKLGYA